MNTFRIALLALALSAQSLVALPASAAPVSPCSLSPIAGFGRAWSQLNVRGQLGCPLDIERGTYAAYQPFEYGFMLWRADTHEILVFFHTGHWQRVVGSWREGMPERAELLTPPAGRQQPKRGFGEVWLRFPDIRDNLGWALAEEVPVGLTFQRYERGLMVWTHATGVLALPAGSWSAPLR